ncbi:hypothetical protein D9753_01195 [Streptomyces dangxiongensis]|uniref:Uncharacterized protein n=1 Tax=Streptomyces dangxiongensis TaxID=1442032 RepID=A0A3G2J6I9_9ACTN|nr:hypothetical protein D9753_01195 [Streptomyces dangxiongensis]
MQYRHTYRLPESELAQLAYLFVAPPRGIDEVLGERLGTAVNAWVANHPYSSLTQEDHGDRIVLVNTRPGYSWRVLELREPGELALFRALARPRNPATLGARVPGGQHEAEVLLDRWTVLGLLFHDDGHVVHVAVDADNPLFMRARQREARRDDWWTAGEFDAPAPSDTTGVACAAGSAPSPAFAGDALDR